MGTDPGGPEPAEPVGTSVGVTVSGWPVPWLAADVAGSFCVATGVETYGALGVEVAEPPQAHNPRSVRLTSSNRRGPAVSLAGDRSRLVVINDFIAILLVTISLVTGIANVVSTTFDLLVRHFKIFAQINLGKKNRGVRAIRRKQRPIGFGHRPLGSVSNSNFKALFHTSTACMHRQDNPLDHLTRQPRMGGRKAFGSDHTLCPCRRPCISTDGML